MKLKEKNNNLKENGITLIALIVTIVILLILAGVTLNAVFSDNGIIKRARDAQTKTDQGVQKDLEPMGELEDLINKNSGENKEENAVKISTLVGTVVDKNTKAVDAYGNKITIPKGFKVLPHGTEAGSATYTYSGDNIPAVQDGIVIENETDGNQFVWVPVGTIKNKDNTTNTITLGRYSDFTAKDGIYIPAQSAEDYTQEVLIDTTCKELCTFREGGDKTEGTLTVKNATARDLEAFVKTSLANGGYYIARFEASGTSTRIGSKYNQTVLTYIEQTNAAKAAREMYGEVKENNKLIYASDLVNSYAWDTAIIFIQTYSTNVSANNYANQNKGGDGVEQKTGLTNDKYCNIWDMSGNIHEWTTETTNRVSNGHFGIARGGDYGFYDNEIFGTTKDRRNHNFVDIGSSKYTGLRSILYVN
mgnify:FL=1